MWDSIKKMLWAGRADERRHETGLEDKSRMLEMDEPIRSRGSVGRRAR